MLGQRLREEVLPPARERCLCVGHDGEGSCGVHADGEARGEDGEGGYARYRAATFGKDVIAWRGSDG